MSNFALLRHAFNNNIGKYIIRVKNIFYSYSNDGVANCSGFFLNIKPINNENFVIYLPAKQAHLVHSMCMNNLNIIIDNSVTANLAVVANGVEPTNYSIVVEYDIISAESQIYNTDGLIG